MLKKLRHAAPPVTESLDHELTNNIVPSKGEVHPPLHGTAHRVGSSARDIRSGAIHGPEITQGHHQSPGSRRDPRSCLGSGFRRVGHPFKTAVQQLPQNGYILLCVEKGQPGPDPQSGEAAGAAFRIQAHLLVERGG
jgi:hypothetical protein